MPSPETTSRLCSLGLFVLPLLTVKLAAVVLGSGPRPKAASGAEPAVAAVRGAVEVANDATPEQWDRQQQQALEHMRRLASAPFGPAPLLYAPPPPEPVVEPEPEPAPIVIEPPVIVPVPAFELHAVMTAASGNKAVVNGRSYQVGDEVAGSGWVVRDIDIDARCVTVVELLGGRSVKITVPGPG